MRVLEAVLATILAGLLLATPASAAPPSAAQKAEFLKTCIGISQDVTLCTCKADAAMTLIDARFMGVVIAAMKGTAAPGAGDYSAYNTYVGRSNQLCKPGY